MAKCGIGACAYDMDTCVEGIVDILIDVISGLIEAALFVLSFWSDAAAAPGLSLMKNAAKKTGQS